MAQIGANGKSRRNPQLHGTSKPYMAKNEGQESYKLWETHVLQRYWVGDELDPRRLKKVQTLANLVATKMTRTPQLQGVTKQYIAKTAKLDLQYHSKTNFTFFY